MSNYFKQLNFVQEGYLFMLSVLLISFAYPSPPITSVAYISLAFFSILTIFKQGISKHKTSTLIFYASIVFILLNFITQYLTEANLSSARLWKLQSFAMVFLAIYLGPTITKQVLKRLKIYFIVSVVVCSLIGLIKVLFLYKVGVVNSFSYINYAVELGVLTTYFAILVCLAVAFLIEYLIETKNTSYNIVAGFSLIFLLFVLSLLSVRMAWLTILFVGGFQVIRFRLRLKKILILIGTVLLVLVVSFFATQQSVLQRISETTEQRDDIAISDAENRLTLWQCGWEQYQENASLFFGIGHEKYQEYLNECYQEKQLLHAFDQSYNVHNQYIQSLLNIGLLGFVVFVFFLLYSLVKSLQYRVYDLSIILISFALFFITESFFEKTLGIIMYATFLGVYWNRIAKKKS